MTDGFDRRPGQSLNAQQKAELVMRVIEGEPLDTVAREAGVAVAELTAWYRDAPRVLETGLVGATRLRAFSCERCGKQWVWQGSSWWAYALRLPAVLWHTKITCRMAQPSVERLNERALQAAKRGHVDRAIRDFKRALLVNQQRARDLDVHHNLAATFVNRGNALMDRGEYDPAMVDFTAAIDLEPDYVEAFVNRSTAWEAKGNHACAIRDCDRAIQLRPSSGLAFNNRGCAYLNNGDYVRAASDFDEAVRLDPTNSMFRENRDVARQNQQQ